MTTPAIRYTTVGSVAVVAGIAAVVSYSHMQQLAEDAGEEWRSWLLPLSIDGLVAAASMVLVTRRRAGLPGGVLAWLLQQRRAERCQDAGELTPAPLPAPTPVEPAVTEAPSPVAPPAPPVIPPAAPALAPVPRQPASSLADRVRPLVAEGLGRDAIAKRLGISQHQARRAIDAVRQEAAA